MKITYQAERQLSRIYRFSWWISLPLPFHMLLAVWTGLKLQSRHRNEKRKGKGRKLRNRSILLSQLVTSFLQFRRFHFHQIPENLFVVAVTSIAHSNHPSINVNLPSSCYTFHCNLVTRIQCYIMIITSNLIICR